MIDMTSSDLNATYYGTFVGYRLHDGTIEPFRVGECHEDNTLRGTMDGDTCEVDINDPRVVLSFPDSGAYQVSPTSCVYVARRAERQWHRGIRERSMSVTGDGHFGEALVKAMFNPTYGTLAVVCADTNFNSVALDRNWWVRKRRDAVHPLIMFRDRVVGELQDGKDVHIPNNQLKTLFEEAVA